MEQEICIYMMFIFEEIKETILDFSQGNVRVLLLQFLNEVAQLSYCMLQDL